MTDEDMLNALYAGFVKCPNTGQVLEVLTGDNKVLCPCRKSNPKLPQEQAERTGVHFVSHCEKATAKQFIAQMEAKKTRIIKNPGGKGGQMA